MTPDAVRDGFSREDFELFLAFLQLEGERR